MITNHPSDPPSGKQVVPAIPSATADDTKQRPTLAGNIMIVDDEPSNVAVVRKLLERAGYDSFITTIDSRVAFNLIQTSQPDVIILDVNMPGVNGIDILRATRSDPSTQHIPILVLTAHDDQDVKHVCLDLGATDFLVKPVDPMELVPRVRNTLQIKSFQDQLTQDADDLKQMVFERTRELEASRRQAIFCLARAGELRDNDTGHHVIRVGRYVGVIAKNLGMPDDYVNEIEMAAQLHDVGKIAVPDSILRKPGKLEPEEYDVVKRHVKDGLAIIQPHMGQDAAAMRRHVEFGAELLEDGSSLMRLAATIAQTHHEKFDGSGYPIGLAGDDIPIEGRITAVADVYDALASERSYKSAMPRQQCFEALEEGRGTHFDSRVLDAFFAGASEIVQIQIEFMDRD
jgi:putative two-component system response regulator